GVERGDRPRDRAGGPRRVGALSFRTGGPSLLQEVEPILCGLDGILRRDDGNRRLLAVLTGPEAVKHSAAQLPHAAESGNHVPWGEAPVTEGEGAHDLARLVQVASEVPEGRLRHVPLRLFVWPSLFRQDVPASGTRAVYRRGTPAMDRCPRLS